MRTSELTDADLDLAVAKCLGHRVAENYGSYIRIHLPEQKQSGYTLTFSPSTDWAQGGPIIEREGLQISRVGDMWEAWIDSDGVFCKGQTPLIAAMRCYVASKLGDEVEIPEEIANENK